jgi:hypothetical protein
MRDVFPEIMWGQNTGVFILRNLEIGTITGYQEIGIAFIRQFQ